MNKIAAALGKIAAYGHQAIATQQYEPVQDRHEFSNKEQAQVDEGKSQWIPKIWQNFSTPVSETMSSPGKGALMHGMGGALVGGLAGAGMAANSRLGGSMGEPASTGGMLAGGLGGAAAVGIPLALLSYFGRKSHNEGVEDIMHRLPRGATMRDFEADPAVQQRQNRQALMTAGALAGGLRHA